MKKEKFLFVIFLVVMRSFIYQLNMFGLSLFCYDTDFYIY